jgi:cytochrome c oxidase assembly factor CtaG
MTIWQFIRAAWTWEPSVVGGCLTLAAGYLSVVGAKPARRASSFLAGVAVLFLALNSPLDVLGDTYLFSAHMIQHLLLILAVPPLLVLGMPATLVDPARLPPWVRSAGRALSTPAVAWALGVGTMVVWHIPALYNVALRSEAVHVLQHMSFLVTSTIFWWPVLAPGGAARLAPLPAVLYLVGAALAGSVLGIIVTFAQVGLYPAYLHPVDRFGIEPLIRNGWGVSPQADQELGGLVMWIPGGLVYLWAILVVVARWYTTAELTDPTLTAPGAAPQPGIVAGPAEG